MMFTISCKKHNPVVNPDPVNAYQKSDFPLAVGNWWRYRKIDVLASYIDTLVLTVISSSTVGKSNIYLCYIQENGMNVDTANFVTNDTVISYKAKSDYSYFGDFTLVMPFTVNTIWGSALDSSKVISYTDSVHVLNNYYNTFFIKRVASSFEYSEVQTITIAKGIGIVMQNLNIYIGGPYQNQNLKLIDYHLQ